MNYHIIQQSHFKEYINFKEYKAEVQTGSGMAMDPVSQYQQVEATQTDFFKKWKIYIHVQWNIMQSNERKSCYMLQQG